MNNFVAAYISTLESLDSYFRSQMDECSPQQQKIISFLSSQYGAVNVKTIAKYLFLSHQTTSSQLKMLLEKKILTRHSVGRESYYEIEDVLFSHWLNVRARRLERIENYVNFVVQFYSKPSRLKLRDASPSNAPDEFVRFIKQLNPKTLQQPEYKELDRLLEYFFLAQEIF